MRKIDISNLREHITNFQFNKMFEVLGWEYPTSQTSGKIKINGYSVPYSTVAEISSVPVLKFNSNNLRNFKTNSEKKTFYQTIKNHYNQYIALFTNEQKPNGPTFFSLSYLSKEGQIKTHSYFKEQSGDYFIAKLSGIFFDIEENEPKIAEIRNKIEKAFDSQEVTKKFFENFKSNHVNFMQYISGIDSKEEKKWFASLILNRLMFIWFLQKKGFVNNDFDYLETKFKESQQRGKNRYYLEFLTLLFFEGFAKKPIERSKKAKALLGNIKYLNGGLFVPHSIEEKYKNKIKIEDKAFDETFALFNQYDWSLHGKKGMSDNEISPDIMGYIFEKYINALQQKSLGAYYTRDEITSYLSRNTIQKCVLEKVNNKRYKFESIADMLHKLDASLCKLLLTNEKSILNTLTVLDPAVGSGAFLVSAMKELINIYSPIIGKIETLGDRDLTNWLKSFKQKNKSILYGIKKNIILKNLYGVDIMKEATEVCKLRLFLSLVSSALSKDELEPLPNMDFNIMCGNSLIGFLNEKNIETQLSLLKTENQLSYTEIKNKYNNLVNLYKNKPLSFEKLKELKSKTQNFLEKHNYNLNQLLANKCNENGLKYTPLKDINEKKKIFGKKRQVLVDDFYSQSNSKNLNPFHWDFAFNEIISQGGFDVIITNPPWERVQMEEKEFFLEYDPTIQKKKTKKSVLDRKKEVILKNKNIKKKFLNQINFYNFQSAYFYKFYQYQSGKVKLSGQSVKDSSTIDTYRLFIERCFCLLSTGGLLGIVLPGGFHKDDGSIGLRRNLLFKKAKIESLIDFQNQMSSGKGKIFEGVHPSFKFLLLNLKKDKPQDEFPCQFMERDLKILGENKFPKTAKMKQSIKQIKEFSPRDCSIIEFKNSKDKTIFKKAKNFLNLSEKSEAWNLSICQGEFRETINPHLFKNERKTSKHFPLYKGGAIWQYNAYFNRNKSNRYIDISSPEIQKQKLYKDERYKNYRLVIRAIARNTDERSLISAIIPKNSFITNTLNEIRINKDKYKLLMLSFFNSFIVDYFLRLKISASVNPKYITPLHIPRLTQKDDYFKELVERSAKLTCIGKEFNELADEIGIARGGVIEQRTRWKLQGEIDAIVATIYNLSKDEFTYILSTFKTGKNQTRLQTLKKYALEAFERNKFFKKAS